MLSFKEQQEKWGEEVRRLFKAGERRSYACGCCGLSNGNGMMYVSSNQACHAGLQVKKASEADYAHTYIMYVYECRNNEGDVMNDEMAVAFLDYLIHNSVYSTVFVQEQDAAEVWKSGVLSTHTDKANAQLTVAAHIAARRLTEYRYIVRTWYELVKRGVEPDLAFLLGHKVNSSWVNGDGSKLVGRMRPDSIDGHTSISVNQLGAGDIYDIVINKKMAGGHNDLYKINPAYHGINDAWCGSKLKIKYPTIQHMCAGVNFVDAVVTGINPFPPAKNDNNSYPIVKVFDTLAVAAIEYYKGLKQCKC